jgi:hypothetical protein
LGRQPVAAPAGTGFGDFFDRRRDVGMIPSPNF